MVQAFGEGPEPLKGHQGAHYLSDKRRVYTAEDSAVNRKNQEKGKTDKGQPIRDMRLVQFQANSPQELLGAVIGDRVLELGKGAQRAGGETDCPWKVCCVSCRVDKLRWIWADNSSGVAAELRLAPSGCAAVTRSHGQARLSQLD